LGAVPMSGPAHPHIVDTVDAGREPSREFKTPRGYAFSHNLTRDELAGRRTDRQVQPGTIT
jgi:hypothetical protein